MQQSFEAFHKKLYAQPLVEEIENFFDLIKLPKVRDEQNDQLISLITDKKIEKAISNLKLNKAQCHREKELRHSYDVAARAVTWFM